MAAYPNIAPKTQNLPPLHIVYENEIQPEQFSSFFAPLSLTATNKRPKVIIKPVGSNPELGNKLKGVRDKIDVFEMRSYGLRAQNRLENELGNANDSDALKYYLNFGFNSVADHPFSLSGADDDHEEVFSSFIKMLMKINSQIRTYGRKSAEGTVLKIFNFLENLIHSETKFPEK